MILARAACKALVRAVELGPLRVLSMRHGNARFDSDVAYIEDRTALVAEYRTLFRPFTSFAGQTVAELGCSRGYLLDAFRDGEHFTAIGIDNDVTALRLGATAYPHIRFVVSTATSIPLDSGSVDIVYTIDTVEHLSRPREMLLECYRILRPGGTFLIHFHPWLGPYGAHLEDIIPWPWPQTVFSMETLLAVAAERYDTPGYRPAAYWYDRETGAPRPNPYRDVARWREYLNRMTIREFRHLIRTLPFERRHCTTLGFGGRRFRLGRALAPLSALPGLDEFFTKAVFAVLRKPVASQQL